MKKALFIIVLAAIALQARGQTNVAVRLALVSESNDASAAADVLTVQLSGHNDLQLLERNEIEKVYREQGLSAGNGDYLKLGQMLGADGLLLLNIVRTHQATNLTARLIAVKPGVVLTDGSFPWPLKNVADWSESVAVYLNSFLQKLALLSKDAIPISIVNLRSAVSSTDAAETERQLQLLAIQRLSKEPQLFVLERQKMQLLSEEKVLKSDESAFWNGAYLLDGIVDQNGYSKDLIIINARLTPPKGGVPLLIEASGSRTNFAEVINHLAAKVIQALKINPTIKEWSAAAEAGQFYDEAKWALRWGVFGEAQAAADSAWALGKHDQDCATIRVKAYETPLHFGYQKGEFTNPNNTNEVIQMAMQEALPNSPLGLTLNEQTWAGTKVVKYVFADRFPDPESIELATHALELYYEFSQHSQADLLKVASAESNWKNSDWYNLGIEDLVAASQVLQNFNFVPKSQKPAADKLAALRALTRSVAEWISKTPSVHDSYFVGDRTATHDELSNTMEEQPSIFKCEANWGCFWQDQPEGCLALYRELMSSPVFCYLHDNFWLRDLQTPRLVAWNDDDRRRLPQLWQEFLLELDASTNVLCRLEARALSLADADNDTRLANAFTNFFNRIFENQASLVANNVEVLYVNWGADDLVNAKTSSGVASDVKESLNHLFYSEFRPKLEAMDQEYLSKTVPAGQVASMFQQQELYLKANKPYDFFEFANLFESRDYSKNQAQELQPLVAAYKSNLVAQSQHASMMQKGKLQGAIAQIEFLENNINRILNPPVQPPRVQPQIEAPKPASVVQTAAAVPSATRASEIVTNVLTVDKFLEIPLNNLVRLSGLDKIDSSRITVTAHHWLEGKLLLNFEYELVNNWSGAAGGSAIAMLDPAREHWDIVVCRKEDIASKNRFYHRSTCLHGELFNCDGGQIEKYDRQSQQWRVLPVSDGNNYELFAINGQLYAANGNTILQILDEGKSTRILASTRRNPPASTLDRENIGTPTLFEGPNHSLRVCTASTISTWAGNDWRADSGVPPGSSQPEIFLNGILFRRVGFLSAAYQNGVIFRGANGVYGVLNSQDEISCLANEASATKLCLRGNHDNWNIVSRSAGRSVQVAKSLWEMPNNLLPNLPAALRQSDLYILEDYFAANASVNDRHEIVQENVNVNNEYNAVLLCFSHDLPLPQKLYLKFNSPDAKAPAWMFPAANLLIFGGNSKGVWLLPTSQLDPAIAMLKQIQFDQKAQATTATRLARQSLLAKYDRKHDGLLDPEEKEEALTDPAFIESELDAIDTNHNGWLDAVELVYFDANQNKILDPKEQAAIDTAQHLFAARLLKKFDADGDGLLNRSELSNLVSSSGLDAQISTAPRRPRSLGAQFPGNNQDENVKLVDLEDSLKQQTRRGLRMRIAPPMSLLTVQGSGAGEPISVQQRFKVAVEFYWQHADDINQQAPASNSQ
jgi:hypothetical protein